ncbi:hypothetical protein DPX16_22814 [Anabarilius grahami]|uniref:Uncharacterized protein n=1 Tax=Anabarilius grahami TaxID=495550 RepID=A0A3N0ZBI0_ANAGA|nr:hypothetical protein DPX16_22814 [Anabarilius grahami]
MTACHSQKPRFASNVSGHINGAQARRSPAPEHGLVSQSKAAGLSKLTCMVRGDPIKRTSFPRLEVTFTAAGEKMKCHRALYPSPPPCSQHFLKMTLRICPKRLSEPLQDCFRWMQDPSSSAGASQIPHTKDSQC